MEYNYRKLFKGLAQYRQPLNYELVGEEICAQLDGFGELVLSVTTGQQLHVTCGEMDQDNSYECVKIDDMVYVLHFEVANQSPRKCLSIVYDKASGEITVFLAKQGHCAEYLRRVEREIYFGSVRQPDGTYPAGRAAYTEDLIGKSIDFTYTSDAIVRHTYIAPHLFKWEFLSAAEGADAVGASQKEYCDYVKINDHIYIFSWLEKIAGVQGFCVENLDRLYHVGGFFGIGPDDLPECYTMAAYGCMAEFDPD